MCLSADSTKKVLITGGAGFIGGTLIRRLLMDTSVEIFNLDKMGYASDLHGINQVLRTLGESAEGRHKHLRVNLADSKSTSTAVSFADPDLVIHLAAESHVDRSISSPLQFVESNIIGTFNLLQALLKHWENLPTQRQREFLMLHISTDEVYGSLEHKGYFSENSSYDPRSPYSATKASSDHLVNSWFHTYGLPLIRTNCSNNYGPWQFPEKLIPMVILKAFSKENIPIYGDGKNIRDWLFVEDHVEALIQVIDKGEVGRNYCIGGLNEKTNLEIVESICGVLDLLRPKYAPHSEYISYVEDRPGHDRRYAINPERILREIGWKPKYGFKQGIEATVQWYLSNLDWCSLMKKKSNYKGERIGLR
ncbi:dTDP-glucose 4,6-dehydratase [Prochlorococcus sp. MIT 1307]|uniref:dTDP-glucose 4,6-dehydratase n=1 Tax=Prochlorococcus sp. MIT 1307 TaxID=3096219 RepID=UPI002A74CE08|nr:dTDP-glucose 4,6-dehydratase [Prochlorococcus sp. MIT 1307]